MSTRYQLISYIAPAAPATRRIARTPLPFLRPEIGFTPKWYREGLGIDFGRQWHEDPLYRKMTRLTMREELDRRFPHARIGMMDGEDAGLDILTGTYGACPVAAIYGVPIRYDDTQWPVSEQAYLVDNDIDKLEPPDLSDNPFFNRLMKQVDWIEKEEGRVIGFINWQGILNNAERLRGQQLFMDMMLNPERVNHLFECIFRTMVDATKLLQERQRESGFDYSFFTVSNCLVNMLSADLYREFVLPFDLRIAEAFNHIGIHNCAWNADPYMNDYAQVPRMGYVDMGMDSDMDRARNLFPEARRAIMYTPMDVHNKLIADIRSDFEKIANEYGPCDIVAADIEVETPDEKVLEVIRICEEISAANKTELH